MIDNTISCIHNTSKLSSSDIEKIMKTLIQQTQKQISRKCVTMTLQGEGRMKVTYPIVPQFTKTPYSKGPYKKCRKVCYSFALDESSFGSSLHVTLYLLCVERIIHGICTHEIMAGCVIRLSRNKWRGVGPMVCSLIRRVQWLWLCTAAQHWVLQSVTLTMSTSMSCMLLEQYC